LPELPSFSVVVETENLAMGGVADLVRCLDSFEAQTVDIRKANEVWLMVGGHLEPSEAAKIARRYPWTRVHNSNADISYHTAKNLGARISTGEIVLFADSDVAYDRRWLELLLREIAANSGREIVASSDTRAPMDSSYGFAMHLVWMLPIRRLGGAVVEGPKFLLNNFAIRRDTILAVPIEDVLPLYRNRGVFWLHRLRIRGVSFHRVPEVLALHLAPQGLMEWWYRMLISGSDAVATADYRQHPDGSVEHVPSLLRRGWVALKWLTLRVRVSFSRAHTLLTEDPRRVRCLPLGIPIALASLFVQGLGCAIGIINGRFMFDRITAYEARQG
jgi:glycosyltransferase involved in cell wall biosynthesis